MSEKNKRLKEFFKDQGMTQSDIAQKLGVTQGTVSALLNGKEFGKKTANAWSEAFGLSPMWLMTGNGEMLSQSTIDASHVQIGVQNTMHTTESERLIALLEKKDMQIQQRDNQIDELIALLKQQMNK